MRTTILFVLATWVILAAETKLPPAADLKIDFEKHVQPLLAQKCHSCHGEDVRQSGLRLDKRQNALRGGDYGPVIIPGKSAESKLIRRLVSGDGGLQMPPTGALSNEEIGILRAWIDQGADFRLEIKETPPKPVDPKVEAFVSAVRSSDVRGVEKQLTADPGLVKVQDRTRSTPLHHAAGFGTLATMKLLVDKGAEVNAKNRRGSTPLFWAIYDEAKVRFLVDQGADINTKQADGRTPLFVAASIGNGNSLLRYLLSKGADPNAATANGLTPLMAASTRGNVEGMVLLIDKGAKVDERNGAGGSALMGAALSGDVRAVRLLLDKGADPKVVNKRKETVLTDAATFGNEEIVKLLLDRGASVNSRDDRGYSPLMYAAGSDRMAAGTVKLLLDKGADPNCVGEDETARMLAAKRGDSEVARLLGVTEEERRQGGIAEPPAAKTGTLPIPVAVQKAFTPLEQQSHNFIRIGGCNSCHAQDLPSAAAALARDRGLAVPKAISQLPLTMSANTAERLMDLDTPGLAGVTWELFDLGMNRAPKDEFTDAAARYLKLMQTAEGNWRLPESRRPPMSSGNLQTSALAVYGLKHYTPTLEKEDTEKALARAAAWFSKEKPGTTQDRVFHLLGLSWSKAAPALAERAGRALAVTQHADGGWSQLPGMGSDAYATGQALYALNVAGKMPTTDPVYQKGVRYLLNTQAADGTWHVKSRSIWVQPYFESGFPYGPDQWISAAGTSWAAMALALTVEPQKISRNIPRN